MREFEKLGKLILLHKYLYYIKGEPIISDFQYDMLESKYIKMAKTIEQEPENHMIEDWSELKQYDGIHAGCTIGFPENHPWAKKFKVGE